MPGVTLPVYHPSAEHIEVDTDVGGSVLVVTDDEGFEHRFKLGLDAIVDLNREGRQFDEYLAEMNEARAAVAAGVPLAEYLQTDDA